MSYILNIETSTTNCSVSLSLDRNLVDIIEEDSSNYSHSENLHVFISKLMSSNKITFEELSAVAVSRGPGSYTGLRIGVSAAKGICYGIEIPLISISSQLFKYSAVTPNLPLAICLIFEDGLSPLGFGLNRIGSSPPSPESDFAPIRFIATDKVS